MRGSVRGASGNRCPYRDCYYWPVLGDRDEVVFHFAPSRAHHHVEQFLGDFEGTLVSDGYGAYAAYAEARGEAVRQQNCWSYVAVRVMFRWLEKLKFSAMFLESPQHDIWTAACIRWSDLRR